MPARFGCVRRAERELHGLFDRRGKPLPDLAHIVEAANTDAGFKPVLEGCRARRGVAAEAPAPNADACRIDLRAARQHVDYGAHRLLEIVAQLHLAPRRALTRTVIAEGGESAFQEFVLEGREFLL